MNIFNPKRPPDFIVGSAEDPYLLRWYLIPRNRFLNIYLHEFWRDDDDRALHDHPWRSLSYLVSGKLKEHLPNGKTRIVSQGDWVFRRADHLHRIEVLDKPTKTLFITGPKIREWGFACPQGWRHWKEFTAPGEKGKVGRGCE